MDVLLLSILAHAVLFTAILLLAAFLPMPKIKIPVPPPTTTLTLTQAPAPPKPKQTFVPTNPQDNVPHKVQPIVSANDTELTSKSKEARKPDSVMPDVTGKEHADALNTKPQVTAPQKPEVSSTPPTPKEDKPQKPTSPQPNPSQGKQPSQQPQPKPLPPTPPKPKPQPQVDENGFPILPALAVPTMAPPNSAAQPLAPAPSQVQQAQSVHGSLGRAGDNSPAAMATELGKYKQYVYQIVGTYWYPAIDKQFGIIGVGMVHIQFTIHSDGTMTDVKVLRDTSPNVMILQTISNDALVKPAPYKPFSDAMIKEVGDSFTDDFTFSVY